MYRVGCTFTILHWSGGVFFFIATALSLNALPTLTSAFIVHKYIC